MKGDNFYVFPSSEDQSPGISVRVWMVGMILQGICAGLDWSNEDISKVDISYIVDEAMEITEEAMNELYDE
jgi:hypothetical protein